MASETRLPPRELVHPKFHDFRSSESSLGAAGKSAWQECLRHVLQSFGQALKLTLHLGLEKMNSFAVAG
jgi:hypothetical protein